MNKQDTPLNATWPRPFLYISGRISLDLSHTGGKRSVQGAAFEQLHTTHDLERWLAGSEINISIDIKSKDLDQAHELREAIWYAAHAITQKKDIDSYDREIINQFAAFATPVTQLGKDTVARWSSPTPFQAILSYIARDAIDLLGTKSKERLRECANTRCPLLFVDTSRPNKRRWCSMERCGLMEKTHRFRSKAANT